MDLLPSQLNCLSNSDYQDLQELDDLTFATFKRFPELVKMLGPVAKAAAWGGLLTPVVNNTGSAIAAKKCVAVNGFDPATGNIDIVLASPTSLNQVLGVTHEAIPDGAVGYVRTGGRWLLDAALNTSGGAVGDAVLLGTSGALSLTPPVSGAGVIVGLVSTVAASGQIVVTPPFVSGAFLATAAGDAQTDATQALADADTANTALGKILSGTLTVLNGQTTITSSVGAAYNGKPVLVSFAEAPTAAAKCWGVVAAGTLTLTIDVDNTADLDLTYLIDGR